MKKIKNILKGLHEAFKPSIHLLTLVLLIIISLSIVNYLETILADSWTKSLIITAIPLVTIYWAARFTIIELKKLSKRKNGTKESPDDTAEKP